MVGGGCSFARVAIVRVGSVVISCGPLKVYEVVEVVEYVKEVHDLDANNYDVTAIAQSNHYQIIICCPDVEITELMIAYVDQIGNKARVWAGLSRWSVETWEEDSRHLSWTGSRQN